MVSEKSIEQKLPDFIDSCSMMSYFGYKLGLIIGPMENIKITTPTDYFIFRAMVQVKDVEIRSIRYILKINQ